MIDLKYIIVSNLEFQFWNLEFQIILEINSYQNILIFEIWWTTNNLNDWDALLWDAPLCLCEISSQSVNLKLLHCATVAR